MTEQFIFPDCNRYFKKDKDSNGFDTYFLIEKNGDSKYIEWLEIALEKAKNNQSKLPEWILTMNGMSGRKYRHFINNFIGIVEEVKYLEVGCWKGSTSCSAFYKNEVSAYCIDNWSEFGGPKNEFIKNIEKCVGESGDLLSIQLEENDFRNVSYDEIGKYNIYFFDGPHEETDQYDGVLVSQSAVEDEFVFICDDWNWEKVRNGTEKAFEKLKLKVIYTVDIRTTSDNTHPVEYNAMEKSDWHNGYFIAVCKKGDKYENI
jgi:hypothetical protein